MSNNQPVTYAKARVVCPATTLGACGFMIQQHIAILTNEPDYHSRHAVVAIRKVDLTRLFGENHEVAKQFVTVKWDENGPHLTWIGLRNREDEGSERFATAIALSETVVEQIFYTSDFNSLDNFLRLYGAGNLTHCPELRLSVLTPPDQFNSMILPRFLEEITLEHFKAIPVMRQWHDWHESWIDNDEVPPNEEEISRPRMNLRDIPLTTRANRRLVRLALLEHQQVLWDTFTKSASQLEYKEWLTQVQGVQVRALEDLEGIDNLPDEQYVEAMVTFKQAEARAYHSQAVKDKKTELHLFTWVAEKFKQDWNDLGRAEALKDIEGIESDSTIRDETQGEKSTVFVVNFDGVIVEDQRPSIGPASPCALSILRALKANGHVLVIMSSRIDSERDQMLEYLQNADCVPHATIKSLTSDDLLTVADNGLIIVNNDDGRIIDGVVVADYVVDHRQFGISTIGISGDETYDQTFYWPDLASALSQVGYLTDEDTATIAEELTASMDAL